MHAPEQEASTAKTVKPLSFRKAWDKVVDETNRATLAEEAAKENAMKSSANAPFGGGEPGQNVGQTGTDSKTWKKGFLVNRADTVSSNKQKTSLENVNGGKRQALDEKQRAEKGKKERDETDTLLAEGLRKLSFNEVRAVRAHVACIYVCIYIHI
jgi:hypothetical protein